MVNKSSEQNTGGKGSNDPLPANEPERVKRAELARILGVSRGAVTKAIGDGRIPGPGPDQLLDRAEAIAAWRANTRAASNQTNHAPADKRAPGGQTKYSSARARKETALAKMAELDLKQRQEQLVERHKVDAFAADAGTRLRVTLQDLPAILAPQLVGRDMDAIHSILDDRMRRALTEFCDSMAEGAKRAARCD